MIFKRLFYFLFFSSLITFYSCSGLKPVYKENISNISVLKSIFIISNKNNVSENIKKELIKLLPNKTKLTYILKINANITSVSSVTDSSRRIARYKVKTEVNIKLYHRKEDFDQLVYSFEDTAIAPYSLVSDNIRSTLASRNNAEKVTVNILSKKIYNKILMYFAENNLK